MNYGKQIRRDIGRQLGIIRHRKKLLLQQVAKDNNIGIKTLDEIEIGFARSWIFYHRLKNYYNCEIKVIERE